jgi:[glutamine synthetase] adenylyltransferase / [glutamine synthetase]-adenylyl-L-tyrosine phosphorylase
MQNAAWRKALERCADPRRAEHYLEVLRASPAAPHLRKATLEQGRLLAALLAGSQAQSELLVAHPDWLNPLLDVPSVSKRRWKERLEEEIRRATGTLVERREWAEAYRKLREFKQREMLRIATRDLARLGKTTEITQEISDVADVCLAAVQQLCWEQALERFGRPYHLDAEGRWQPTGFSVIGLGKLGGQELNYSSDVDVILVYSEEGPTFRQPPRPSEATGRGLSNHQFFLRLAEAFIAEVTRLTSEGSLFRIDLRLRPEGKAGPLARSISSYESYYAQWGQTWERMMLIKARPIGGDPVLGAEFLEMIQPFRYPRSMNQRVLQEIAAMKDRIETEVVKSGEIDRNVKLGRGGIREIEFVTQTLQLLHGGRNPFIQDPQTLPALEKLARYNLIPGEEARALSEAYCWLRDIEHRLQMENNLQTHTIPTERQARQRLAALMGCGSLAEFERTHARHTQMVRRTYDALLKMDEPGPKEALPELEGHRDEWLQLLAGCSVRDAEKAYQLIREFVHGPGYVHVSPRTVELAMQLLPRFLALCPTKEVKAQGPTFASPRLSDPDRVLARLDSFVSAYGARATLYELWSNNPALFGLLLMLFDRSEFLAESAIRTPDLVDELELSGRLRRSKSAEETLRDLRHGLQDADQRGWLRRYHQAELMRIGLRDILGLADFEQNLVELSALADACLAYALEVVLRKHGLKSSPFAVIGLGKLGGAELNYGSDLDIMFVAESKAKSVADLQRLAVELMDMLSSQTELGVAFQTDARLRPDGEKGLLVNTVSAYEEYYRQRAQLWELQAISRTRPIAGHREVGERFQELAKAVTDFREPPRRLSAYTPSWKQEIHRMRQRIEKERTPAGKQPLAIKTGAGGLIDAEFVAQTLCMANGWHEANTLRTLWLAREAQVLPRVSADWLIDNYRQLRRVEGILRRWSYVGETVLPDDPAPLYRVAVRCGYTGPEHFLKAVAEYRAAIRTVYLQVMEPATANGSSQARNPPA